MGNHGFRLSSRNDKVDMLVEDTMSKFRDEPEKGAEIYNGIHDFLLKRRPDLPSGAPRDLDDSDLASFISRLKNRWPRALRNASSGSMGPSELSRELNRIATALDNSHYPSKELVLEDINRVVSRLSLYGPTNGLEHTDKKGMSSGGIDKTAAVGKSWWNVTMQIPRGMNFLEAVDHIRSKDQRFRGPFTTDWLNYPTEAILTWNLPDDVMAWKKEFELEANGVKIEINYKDGVQSKAR